MFFGTFSRPLCYSAADGRAPNACQGKSSKLDRARKTNSCHAREREHPGRHAPLKIFRAAWLPLGPSTCAAASIPHGWLPAFADMTRAYIVALAFVEKCSAYMLISG